MTGSIHEKAGQWYVVVSFKDNTNKWKTKWISTGLDIKGNKRAAEKMMREMLDDLSDKNVEMSDVLLADYFECWLDEQKAMVEPNTYRSYRGNMKNHIIPYFRGLNLKLKDLKTYHLDEYYNYKYSTDSMLNGKGKLSASTIKHHHQNISKALNDAVRKELIARNPAVNARTPRTRKYRSAFLNFHQVNRLIELVKGTVIEIPVVLLATYGMRRSECLALKWEDVDFENMQFIISSSILQHTGGDYERGSTKNESSYRTLHLTEKVKELLGQKRAEQNNNKKIFKGEYCQSDYICTWNDGRLIAPNYLTRTFKKIIKNSDLPDVHIHSLRHSVASNLLASGFSVVDVQHFLGHSDASTTLSFYSHIDGSSKVKTAEALNERLEV